MTQASLPIQNSVVALTAALSAAVGQVALPEPVLKAAQQVLGQRLVLDGGKLDGTSIREAVRTSGVFQESLIATGRVSLAAADTKTALLGLRQALVSWLGARAPVEPVAHVPPPVRGHTPRARNGVRPGPLPLDPVEAGKHLLDRTEQALARLRLHQQASLPEQSVKADAQFSLDLPVMVAGQQSLLHMQIHGDPQQTEQDSPGRGWQVRFALNLSGIGEVGAQISMRGRAAGLMLWTENAEVASLLQDDVAALRAELNAVGVEVGSIVVRGAPPPAEPAKGGAGVNLDAVR
ncbi:flagellar hook-length control protein FliK [Devosia sp. PTR5]|uniref:Flagellar hook-length control protein FliK n=1 Tax=Devosia oryzisoli TaxID=2774138 RepID=A0A927IRT3_9HYPH|nr:flagellar hook-length control protein FliK [Devosia oryzisoli]MBD8064744.1 flagellar hook-length control protein FliK [Devosia oryzisoli]